MPVIVSKDFTVIEIQLDSGTVFLSDIKKTIGTDSTIPCVLRISSINDKQVSFEIEKQALPDYVQSEVWINRKARILSSDNINAIIDGAVLIDGVIKNDPTESNGIYSLSIYKQNNKKTTLPNFGSITLTQYPNAPSDSQGKLKPLIFGYVNDVEFIPVDVQEYSILSSDIDENSNSIEVFDATVFKQSGSVTIDGVSYTYSSRTNNKLLGVSISQLHRAGTAVAQTGQAQYIAAGHSLTSIDNVKADGVIISPDSVDTLNASVLFNSYPTINEVKAKENITAEFDQIDATDTATLSVNAIRAVTATDSNISANGLPFSMSAGSIELSRNGVINFPPPSQDRIIKGAYVVTFSVNHNGNTGNAEIKIGDTIVWVLNGGNVVYNNSPASFFYNESTNQLPVSITRDSTSASIDLNITSATRTINLGNLDASSYGQVANGQQFVANQTTNMTNRGKIKRAQLAVEWFATDEKLGASDVYFDNVLLGQLDADNLSGKTVTENITVDIVNQGSAFLASTDVTKSFSGGTASLSNVTHTFNESFPIYYRETGEAGGAWRFSLDFYIKAPVNVASSGHIAQATWISGNTDGFGQYPYISINGQTITANNLSGGSWAISLSGISANQEIPVLGEFFVFASTQAVARDLATQIAKMIALKITWSINNITQNNTPTYESNPQYNRNLGISGITTTHSGGGQNINISIPAPPRTIVNTFPLPQATLDQWQYFTNKQAKITYTTTGTESIALVRVVLLIDYDVVANKPAKKITANVIGKSGNPADVIKYIASSTEERIDIESFNRLGSWALLNSYVFSRVISNRTDALQLLYKAVEQSSSTVDNSDSLSITRWFDMSGKVIKIDEKDILKPEKISWSNNVYNNILLKYDNNKKSIIADKSNNNYCNISNGDIKEEKNIEIQAGFISDDNTANIYLLNYARKYAQRRRVITIDLPFVYNDIKKSSIIDFKDTYYRVNDLSTLDSWITLTAEEIK